MGTFVSSVSGDVSIGTVNPIGEVSGDWNGNIDAWSPTVANLVTSKFDTTMATAEEMLELLTGTNGYLSQLSNIISGLAIPDISYTPVNIPDLSTAGPSAPAMQGVLDLAFPAFNSVLPSLSTIPTIDLSLLSPPSLPAEIQDTLSWLEQSHDISLFTSLLTRLLTDLQSGATGLDPIVEQEIFDRALARQTIEFNKTQQETEQYFASRGFDLPPGAMAGRLQEQANERARNVLDLNAKIMIEQAELAQKNSQFIIQVSKDLEAVLRDFTSKQNDRSLDYAKALAINAISIYSENVKAYIASAEANKAYIEAQVENLKGTVEYNKGLVGSFTAEVDAYNALISGKSSKNKAITDVYSAEISGYETESRALTENQKARVAEYELRIKNADSDLQAQIAELDAIVKGYSAEYGLREKVAESMANIASQALASAYGAVNASAGMSYSGSESASESWGHSESRSENFSHSESLSNTSSFTLGISNDLKESHDYKEK